MIDILAILALVFYFDVKFDEFSFFTVLNNLPDPLLANLMGLANLLLVFPLFSLAIRGLDRLNAWVMRHPIRLHVTANHVKASTLDASITVESAGQFSKENQTLIADGRAYMDTIGPVLRKLVKLQKLPFRPYVVVTTNTALTHIEEEELIHKTELSCAIKAIVAQNDAKSAQIYRQIKANPIQDFL
jgi:hypothetical protein